MSSVKRLLTAVLAAVVLLAVLSLKLLNRQSSHVRMTLLMREGWLAMETGDYGTAIDSYRLAVSLNERETQAYLQLAKAYERNGDLQEALYILRLGTQKTDSEKIRIAYNTLLGSF